MSRRADTIYMSIPLGTFCCPLPLLLPACPSSAWCHFQLLRCFPRSLSAAQYELPLLGQTSKWPPHWPLECQRHCFQILEYPEIRHLLRNTPPPKPWSRYISGGIPDGLRRPLPPLPLTLGLQSQLLNAVKVDVNSPAHCASTAAATMCTPKFTQRITHLSLQIGTVWQPNTAHSYVGIWHINWTSVHLKYMLNPLVSWDFPDGPSSSPVDPENPGYKSKSSLLQS